MLKNYFLITFFLFFSPFTIAMDRHFLNITKPHSIAFLHDKKVAVVEEKRCVIFDQESRKPIRFISTEEKFFDIATNKDKTLLALSVNWQAPIICDVKSDTQHHASTSMYLCSTYIAIDSTNNTLIAHNAPQLLCYDIVNKKTIPSKLRSKHIAGDPFSCHPEKNECIFLHKDQQLAIAQLGHTPYIKTFLSTNYACNSADYAHDNDTIIISNCENGQSNYFICKLDIKQLPIPAYQLIADNCDYMASKFHPLCSIVALLSSNRVHFFDYITYALVAKTKRLSSNHTSDISFRHKRLDFDHNGKYLAAALSDTWEIIKVPQNNMSHIWCALYDLLPKEVTKHIMSKIIGSYKETYDFIDFKSLWHPKPIKPADIDHENTDPIQVEPKTKQIVFMYERKLASPQPSYNDDNRHNHWGNLPWHARADYK
jgi:hypothetical protein